MCLAHNVSKDGVLPFFRYALAVPILAKPGFRVVVLGGKAQKNGSDSRSLCLEGIGWQLFLTAAEPLHDGQEFVMLPWTVGADGDKTASRFEEFERVGDVVDIRAILKGLIHQNHVESAQLDRRATQKVLVVNL